MVDVGTPGATHGNDPAIAIYVTLLTGDRCPTNPVGQGERRPLATVILAASGIFTPLSALGCINPVQPNASSSDLDGVAVNDGCLTGDWLRESREWNEREP